ncbi:hypothetical protein F2Q69_00003606 [Brassica cretica]|uniref:Uncharacterized protein n=1 Tax=Brassica cretica TaxID=69181 RepID=A0A8S9P6H6_BRACR|nr:hypothetical protein F2Q69_00003606 [Brassica cretica]
MRKWTRVDPSDNEEHVSNGPHVFTAKRFSAGENWSYSPERFREQLDNETSSPPHTNWKQAVPP